MTPVPLWPGEVTASGRVRLDDRAGFARYTRTFAGKPVEIVLRARKSQRSTQANRYYWGAVIAVIADSLGYTPEEAHEAMAWHFLKKEGGPLPTRRSTADLSVEEFAKYVNDVKMLATVLGVVVPDDDQVEY